MKIIGIFQKICILIIYLAIRLSESIQDDYIWNKENDKGKEKDDYSIEM